LTQRLVIEPSDTIREKVYNHLREQILRGTLAPGQRLVEAAIAKEIGTSRTPVREALHALEREGLIESRPRVGYAVKPVSEEEVEEICAIRATIEALAAEWALRRSAEAVLHDLSTNVAAAERHLSEGKVRDFVDLDAQFHEILARGSGSSRLLELAQTLRSHMLRYRVQSIYSAENVRQAIEGHKRIIAAMRAGQLDEVGAAIRRHMNESKDATLLYGFGEAARKNALGE
jgi:GntR family transcriptional regulator, rspAB operon transcriptional repressor